MFLEIHEKSLKSRHGNFVVYDVDYLLDNLAREVALLESSRREKRKINKSLKELKK